MIKVGDKLPSGNLQEFVEVEGEIDGKSCSIGPNTFDVQKASAGKTIAIFGLPGAFTPTCSAQHVPGYVRKADELKAAGIDEIWCVSVNDAFVMGAWGKDQGVGDKVMMLADGSADFTKKMGLELDLVARGLGVRSQRFALVVKDGKVAHVAVEEPGAFEVSRAEAVLEVL
jgi:glutaredoxin/glutathione-dependent peroxiredoxin